jgi:hypothetical protein
MNGLDLRALGWVVTRDAAVEVAHATFGGRRRIPLAALRELGDRWRAVQASPTANQPEPLIAFLFGKFTASASNHGEKAVVEFVDSLQACSPELYSEQALRHRYLNAARQAAASFALGAILARWTSADVPIIGDAAFVLFAIACWSLVTTIQLWRTHHLVKRISQFRSLHAPSTADHRDDIRTDRHDRGTSANEHRPSGKG